MTAILAAIAGVGAIVGSIVYIIKTGVWAFNKTPAQTDQDIDATIQKEKQEAEQTGRPV